MSAAEEMLFMMLTLSRKREFVTQTFNSSETWVAPAGVIEIVSLVGKAQDGYQTYTLVTTPASTTYTMKKYLKITYSDGSSSGAQEVDSYATTAGAAVPPPYQEIYPTQTRDYFYTKQSQTTPESSYPVYEDVTGASTTGFGYTFPGSSGSASPPASYADIAITPGNSFQLVIPSGGYITITY